MTADDVLERRARALARPATEPDDGSAAGSTPMLRFRADGGRYAVALEEVREVVPLAGASLAPRAAWPVMAVGAVGGRIVPVVALPAVGDTSEPRAFPWGIAVEVDGTVVCLPADEVEGLLEVDVAAVTPAMGDDRSRSRGITREGDVLLDVPAIVASIGTTPSAGHDRRTYRGGAEHADHQDDTGGSDDRRGGDGPPGGADG